MVTSFFTGIYAIMFIFLSINIIKGRKLNKILIGDNGSDDMLRRIRAQSNFLEYAVFFVLVLILADKNGLSPLILAIAGALFLLARVMHMYSLLVHEKVLVNGTIRKPIWRMLGIILSFVSILALSLFDICYPIYSLLMN